MSNDPRSNEAYTCTKDLITRIAKKKPFAVNDRGGRVNYGPYQRVDEFYNDWPAVAE